MGDLPWDLVYYGSMAIIFIGIIAASRRARKARREADQGDDRTVPGAVRRRSPAENSQGGDGD